MRILVVSDGFPPELGGVERHVAELVKYVSDRGNKVTVITRTNPTLKKYYKLGNVDVLRVLDIPRPYRVDSSIRAIISIRIHLKKIGSHFDIIHYHGMFSEAFIGLGKSLPPLILSVHGHFLSCPRYTRIKSNGELCTTGFSFWNCMKCMSYGGVLRNVLGFFIDIYAWIIQKVRIMGAKEFNNIIYVSNAVLKTSAPFVGLKGAKVIYNFVSPLEIDMDNSTSIVELYNLRDSEFIVLFSARLSPEKGLPLFLKAWKKFKIGKADAKLIITGDGPQSIIAESAARNGSLNVQFLGRVGKQELNSLMKRADLFVVPSIWDDPCPTTALESLRLGTVVAGSNLGGLPEILHNCEDCLLFNPFNIDSVVEALSTRYSQRNKISSVSIDSAFTLEHVGKAIIELYRNIVKNKNT